MKWWILLFCVLAVEKGYAQESFDDYRSRLMGDFFNFKDSVRQDYEQFRKKINEDYCEMLRQVWKGKDAVKGIPMPKEKPVPPLVLEDQDRNRMVKSRLRPVEVVVPIVQPQPQPVPVIPVQEHPSPMEVSFPFTFMGSAMQVRLDESHQAKVRSIVKKDVASFWSAMSGGDFDTLLGDCLKLRDQYALCDWAYLLMLRELSNSLFGSKTDGAVMLTAWLYCQSGYQMRLASQENGRLVLLFASRHTIFERSYWELDGTKYYALDTEGDRLSISPASFPQEQPLSLCINQLQHFAVSASTVRKLQSERYPEVSAQVSVNQNMIDFYATYPSSSINGDIGTRWAFYANTPIEDQASQTLYPSLKASLSGRSVREAVECLLNFVQTAFEYEYDDKIWGHDRVFFAEETLYYPYSDCEDRTILFTRLVRDLLNIEAVLLYYPNHLAAAVFFSGEAAGDYVMVDGKKYIVCDPTYIGGRVGETMPGMDNTSCKVIRIR